MAKHGLTTLERFMQYVSPEPNSGCWLWIAAVGNGGYGVFNLNGREGAHRVAYTMFVGPIPEGMDLDHKCRVRCCVNPQHLDPVTRRENLRRGVGVVAQFDKQRCDKGHEYNKTNTYFRKSGKKQCRLCARPHDRKRKRHALIANPTS